MTAAGLLGLAALAWIYLARLSAEMDAMAAMGMPAMGGWSPMDALLAAGMWGAMMVGMMLPTAAPMVLVFATVNRKRRVEGGAPCASVALFTLGYLLVWGAFSVAAAAAQWGLAALAVLSEETMRVPPLAGGILLVAAGVYQLTPLKHACLARCQTPFGFLLSEWREGRRGALVMGLRHGLFCLGCRWVLMALLFVGGVMNLAWAAAIAAFVLLEKLLPLGPTLSWTSGAALLLWGLVMLRSGW